eukprot:m.54551 g.54551  ORF g.54551 m.54551 type:complete len:86 (+) comp34381_c0_seq1:87-344(+)
MKIEQGDSQGGVVVIPLPLPQWTLVSPVSELEEGRIEVGQSPGGVVALPLVSLVSERGEDVGAGALLGFLSSLSKGAGFQRLEYD